MRRTFHRRRAVLAFASLSLLATACGTRVPDADFATVGDGLGGGGASSGGGGGGAVASGGGASGSGVASGSEGKFGTLDIPCGPGDTSSYTATDKGVTKDTIAITTISDPAADGPKPGIDQGVFDSMEAFSKWCNELGGINGRKLKLTLRDAGILKYKEQVLAACAEDFALVGGMGILDNLGAQDQVDCGLPNVPGVAVNPEQTGADLTYQSLPNLAWRYNVGPTDWVKQRFPDSIQKAAAIYTNLSVAKIQSDRLAEAYTKRGFTFVSRPAADISEANWGPKVSDMKNKGVTFMSLTSSFEEVVPLAKAMKAQNFKPVVELETNYYNDKFPKATDGEADGFFVRSHTWPLEEADKNPAAQQYVEILTKYKKDAVKEFLGVQAFSSALLWATAVKKLGANVTRDGLERELQNTHYWDGGGLQAPSDPGARTVTACFVIMKVEGDHFVREYPLPDKDADVYNNKVAKGMACPDNAFVELTGDGSGVDYRSLGAKKGGTPK